MSLWKPSSKTRKNSNLFKFETFLSKNYNYKISKNFKHLHNWSIKNSKLFWNAIWDYCEIKGKKNNKFKLKGN